MRAIDKALRAARGIKGRPQVLLCKTVMGTPISFMLNKPKWHGVAPNHDELVAALAELGVPEGER